MMTTYHGRSWRARALACIAIGLLSLGTGCSLIDGGPGPGAQPRASAEVPKEMTRERVEAARDGDPSAQLDVARRFLAMDDTERAWPWACLAAVGGDKQAQRIVGEYYWHGRPPVARDIERAYMWYSLAEQHDPAGELTRVEVAMEMPPEAVEAAARKLKDWKPDRSSCRSDAASAAAAAPRG
jgi:hypothetical protein